MTGNKTKKINKEIKEDSTEKRPKRFLSQIYCC